LTKNFASSINAIVAASKRLLPEAAAARNSANAAAGTDYSEAAQYHRIAE
jgi:hypothetical protein